jgi:uncharacterized integral membrane protein
MTLDHPPRATAGHLDRGHAHPMTSLPESSSTSPGHPLNAAGGRHTSVPAGRSRSESVRLVFAGALAALAVAFAALNVTQVEVDWILTTSKTPLIVVIVVSLLVGAVLGFVVGRRSRKAPSGPPPAEQRG